GPVGTTTEDLEPPVRVRDDGEGAREDAAERLEAEGQLVDGRERSDTPHGGVDAALPVADAEIAALAPACAPAVLAHPELPDIAVADDAHAVTTCEGRGAVPVIRARCVGEEVVIDAEAGNQRPLRREPCLHRIGRGEGLGAPDLRHLALPARGEVAPLV